MTAIDRRGFLAFSPLAVLPVMDRALARGRPLPADSLTLAETQQGPVRGTALEDSVRFLGIPFAAPPVGPLRFRAPRPPARRKQVFDAGAFAPAAIQNEPVAGLYGPGPLPTTEDCLYLNVWRPLTPGPHPVYVWVHGGGNVAGASRMPVFDGARLARQGIVSVTVAYRVGALGFLDVSNELGGDYAGSGNNGLLDITAALRWVRENVAAFGGNPAAVTLGGQSAGAKNVCTLLAMPQAHGLFRAAIVESGGAETAVTADRAAEMTRQFVAELPEGGAAGLLSLPPAVLLAAQNRFSRKWNRKYPFRAVVDGQTLPHLPLASMREGHAAPVPLLIGTTRDEIAFFGPNAARDGGVVQGDLANMALSAFEPVYAEHRRLLAGRTAVDQRYAALTAEEYWLPSIRAAEAHARQGRSAWLYRLDMPRAVAPNAGYAVHGSELPLVWDKVADPQSSYLGPDGAEGQALAEVMHRHWVSFIRTGHPADGAAWPRYEARSRPTMLFDARSRAVPDPDGALRRLWAGAAFDFS